MFYSSLALLFGDGLAATIASRACDVVLGGLALGLAVACGLSAGSSSVAEQALARLASSKADPVPVAKQPELVLLLKSQSIGYVAPSLPAAPVLSEFDKCLQRARERVARHPRAAISSPSPPCHLVGFAAPPTAINSPFASAATLPPAVSSAVPLLIDWIPQPQLALSWVVEQEESMAPADVMDYEWCPAPSTPSNLQQLVLSQELIMSRELVSSVPVCAPMAFFVELATDMEWEQTPMEIAFITEATTDTQILQQMAISGSNTSDVRPVVKAPPVAIFGTHTIGGSLVEIKPPTIAIFGSNTIGVPIVALPTPIATLAINTVEDSPVEINPASVAIVELDTIGTTPTADTAPVLEDKQLESVPFLNPVLTFEEQMAILEEDELNAEFEAALEASLLFDELPTSLFPASSPASPAAEAVQDTDDFNDDTHPTATAPSASSDKVGAVVMGVPVSQHDIDEAADAALFDLGMEDSDDEGEQAPIVPAMKTFDFVGPSVLLGPAVPGTGTLFGNLVGSMNSGLINGPATRRKVKPGSFWR